MNPLPHDPQHGIRRKRGGPNSRHFLLPLEAMRNSRLSLLRRLLRFVHSKKPVEKGQELFVENGVQGHLHKHEREEENGEGAAESTLVCDRSQNPHGNWILGKDEKQPKPEQRKRMRITLRLLHGARNGQARGQQKPFHKSCCASQRP